MLIGITYKRFFRLILSVKASTLTVIFIIQGESEKNYVAKDNGANYIWKTDCILMLGFNCSAFETNAACNQVDVILNPEHNRANKTIGMIHNYLHSIILMIDECRYTGG